MAMNSPGLPNSDYTKRLTIAIQGTVLGMAGMDIFRKAFAEINGLQDSSLANAKRNAAAAAAAQKRALTEQTAAAKEEASIRNRLDAEQLRNYQLFQNGMVDAAERSTLKIRALQDSLRTNQARQEAAALASTQATVAATAAAHEKAAARARAAWGSAFSMAGTAFLGAGAVGALGGYDLIRSASDWQRFILQQTSSSPIPPSEVKRIQAAVFRMGANSGANLQDLFTAYRYGADYGFPLAQNSALVRVAMQAALPRGGSIADYVQAIGGAVKNFPGMSPLTVGNEIIAAAQLGRANPNDFTNAISRVLMIAGTSGNQQNLPQALAAVSSLTQHGLPVQTAAMMMYNMLFKLMKPSGATETYLQELKRAGVNVEGDFGPQALQTKGLEGIIADLRAHGVTPTQLGNLFPNLRGYFGALGLAGSQTGFLNYQKTVAGVENAGSTNPIGSYYEKYLQLPTTQAAKLQNQFKELSITLGTSLLPGFIKLEKELIPLGKDFSAWVKQNQGAIDKAITLTPYLIGIGAAFKGISLGIKAIDFAKTISNFIGITNAVAGGDGSIGLTEALGGTAANTGLIGALKGAKTATVAEKGALSDLGKTADTAIGADGSLSVGADGTMAGAAGTGLLGTVGVIVALAGAMYFATTKGNALNDALTRLGHIKMPSLGPFGFGGSLGGAGYDVLLTVVEGAMGMSPKQAAQIIRNTQWWKSQHNGGGNGLPPGTPGLRNYPSSPSAANAPAPAGYANPDIFGLTGVGSYYHGENYNGWTRYHDQLGLTYAGGGKLAHDSDYGLSQNEAVRLPGSPMTQYTLVKDYYQPGVGWIEAWRAPNGGVFEYVHLSKALPKSDIGKRFTGGTVVGVTGQPTNGKAGYGKQLSVIADTKGQQYLNGVRTAPGAGPGGLQSGLDLQKLPPSIRRWAPLIVQAAAQTGTRPADLAAIMWQESKGDPNAIGKPVKTIFGTSRAYGLMQVMDFNFPSKNWNWRNPWNNILRGAQIFAQAMKDHKGNVNGALNSYTGGYGSAYNNPVEANASNWTGSYGTSVPGPTTAASYTTNTGGAGGGNGHNNANPQPGPKMPTNPAGWASWWSSKKSHGESALNTILQYYENGQGVVQWNKMPKAVRQSADYWIRQIAYDEYESERSTINAQIRNPATRKALLAAAWAAYQKANSHPEIWWNNGKPGHPSGAGDVPGRVRAIHQIGSNRCAAEEANRKHHKKTEENTHETAVHTKTMVDHTKWLPEIHHTLIRIEKLLAGGDQRFPRTGSHRIAPHPGL